jgi:hypothetical protein
MAVGSDGCRAALVRHQLTPGLISLLLETDESPRSISFSTSSRESVTAESTEGPSLATKSCVDDCDEKAGGQLAA